MALRKRTISKTIAYLFAYYAAEACEESGGNEELLHGSAQYCIKQIKALTGIDDIGRIPGYIPDAIKFLQSLK